MGVLGLCPPQFRRNYSRWRVLRIATPRPRALLEHLEILPKLPTPLLPQPTPTCGRRRCSRSPPTRSSRTSCQRTTDLWESRDRNRSSIETSQFTAELLSNK